MKEVWQYLKEHWLRVLLFLGLWLILGLGAYQLLFFVSDSTLYVDGEEENPRALFSLMASFGLTAVGFYIYFGEKKTSNALRESLRIAFCLDSELPKKSLKDYYRVQDQWSDIAFKIILAEHDQWERVDLGNIDIAKELEFRGRSKFLYGSLKKMDAFVLQKVPTCFKEHFPCAVATVREHFLESALSYFLDNSYPSTHEEFYQNLLSGQITGLENTCSYPSLLAKLSSGGKRELAIELEHIDREAKRGKWKSVEDIIIAEIFEHPYSDEVLSGINSLLDETKGSPEFLVWLKLKGDILRRSDDINGAAHIYQNILTINKENVEAYKALLDILYSVTDGACLKKNVRDAALSSLLQVQDNMASLISDWCHDCCSNLALVLEANGRHDEVLIVYNKAISLLQNQKHVSWADVLLLGILYKDKGKNFEKMERIQDALSSYYTALEYWNKIPTTEEAWEKIAERFILGANDLANYMKKVIESTERIEKKLS